MKKDSLFDNKITVLDFVKLALLVVTLFSTWRIMDLITPDDTFAIVRIVAAVIVVEGAFVAFERLTKNAKTQEQSDLATLGFFCSLFVIVTYLALTGFLESGGPVLLSTKLGTWAGIVWTVNELVMIFALGITAIWIGLLATIARFFALKDPDKQNELMRNQLDGDVTIESNKALKKALLLASPMIAIQRVLLKIEQTYGPELTAAQLADMKRDVEAHLRDHYQQPPAPLATPALDWFCLNCDKTHLGEYDHMFCSQECEVSWLGKTNEHNSLRLDKLTQKAPVVRPVRITPVPEPAPVLSGNGNGNGHHPTP